MFPPGLPRAITLNVEALESRCTHRSTAVITQGYAGSAVYDSIICCWLQAIFTGRIRVTSAHAYLLRPPITVSLSMLNQHSRSLLLDEPLRSLDLDLGLLSSALSSCRCFLRGSSISPSSRSSSESDSESTRRRRYCFFMPLLMLSRCNEKGTYERSTQKKKNAPAEGC